MRSRFLPAAFVVSIVGVLGLCAACSSSSSNPAPAQPGSVPVGPGPGSGVEGGITDAASDADAGSSEAASPDAATEDAAPPVCNALALDGPDVPETLVAGAPPGAVGGAIAVGTYFLTERDLYASAGAGTVTKRTLLIAATTFDSAETVSAGADAGAATEDTADSTYAVFDSVLSFTAVCPTPGSVTNLGFSVVGNELWIFPSPERRDVYTHQ
jgi:hypothetical protein